MDSHEHERLTVKSSEGVAASVLLILAFITPILFLPGTVLPFEIVKRFFVGIAVALALVFWLVSRLSKSRVSIPKSYVFLGLGGLTLANALSAFFVESLQPMFCRVGGNCIPGLWAAMRAHSFVGLGYELNTPLWLAILSVLLFLAGVLMSDRKRVFYMYLSIFGSAALVVVYTIFRIFPARWLVQYEWYQNLPVSLVGKWNELGIFFGLTVLGIVVMIDLLRDVRASGLMRFGMYLLFGLSMLGLMFINFYPVWVALALFSIVIYVYALTADRSAAGDEAKEHKVFRPSLLVVIVAVLFVFGGSPQQFIGAISARVNNYFGIPQVFSLEPRPGFSDTIQVAEQVLGKEPVLGVGPNNFDSAWARYKPASFNQSLAWNVDFENGNGYLPSFAITAGVLGLIFVLIFIAAVLIEGWRTMSKVLRDRMANPLAAISFFVTLYLWIFAVMYTPNITLLTLAVLSLGTMIALSVRSGALAELSLHFGATPRITFISTLVIIVLIVVSVGGGYLLLGRTWATTLFFRGLARANINGDLDAAETYITQAAGLGMRDQYLRALTNISILRISRIVSQQGVPEQTLRSQFLQQVDNATKYARMAYEIRPHYYQNVAGLASVFEVLSVFKVPGAKEEAEKRYAEVSAANPESPLVPYLTARMYASLGNTAQAQKSLETVLAKKPDYPEAILFYSQIEASRGNIRNAALIAERALVFAPNDLGVLFQAGYLKYQDKAYEEARIILERARALAPNYSNAKYFLGLTYDELGERDEAIQEFIQIGELNPDNEEVKQILANLRAGLPALAGIR